jgi:hypothetical protein
MVIWYVFPVLVCFTKLKSGNPESSLSCKQANNLWPVFYRIKTFFPATEENLAPKIEQKNGGYRFNR